MPIFVPIRIQDISDLDALHFDTLPVGRLDVH